MTLQEQSQKAKALFLRLFNEASVDPGPVLPTYFVPRSVFYDQCKKAGLPIPENIIAFFDWEESIRLPEFCHKVFAEYYRTHGSDFTPIEKGAYRLYLKRKKAK